MQLALTGTWRFDDIWNKLLTYLLGLLMKPCFKFLVSVVHIWWALRLRPSQSVIGFLLFANKTRSALVPHTMALNSLFCADVPLSNYSLTLTVPHTVWIFCRYWRRRWHWTVKTVNTCHSEVPVVPSEVRHSLKMCTSSLFLILTKCKYN